MAGTQINFDFDNDALSSEDRKKLIVEAITPKPKRGRKAISDYDASPGVLTVPEDKVLFQKQYYTISEVAAMFSENISLIRYWTNQFSNLKPKLNKKGDRYYRPEDVKTLKLIYHLLRERKYTLKGAKDFLKNNKVAGENQDLIESLEKVKAFLLELKSNL